MVNLNTTSGDGGLLVGVDAYGAFGSSVGGTETSDAIYDPLGSTEEAGTVFESFIAIGINGDEDSSRLILSEESLGNPGFIDSSTTEAESTFNVLGLDFILEQEVTDFIADEERVGSDLVQTYTITNNTEETVEFELVRYLDGDLSFDGSILDTGGLYFESDEPILFETDSGDSGTNATTFVGISSYSNRNEISSNYEISQFNSLRTNISLGEPLNNTIQGDGDDDDQFIDGEPYDVALGLSDIFVLEPGESLTYETLTFFGFGIPEDLGDEIDTYFDDVDVYRFFRTDTQTQFYTTTEVELDFVQENLPQYQLEGISFVAPAAPEDGEDPLTGTSPVYRFFNRSTGIHLYTADENERAFVEENLDNYVAEGTPFYGYDTQVEGTVPLYRFYNVSLDAHFYTPSAEERDFYISSPDYVPEGGGDGIAFYVEPPPSEL